MSPRFYLVVIEFGVNQENQEAGGSKIPLCNTSGGELLLRPSLSYNKLLGRVAFRILSSIYDGALLRK